MLLLERSCSSIMLQAYYMALQISERLRREPRDFDGKVQLNIGISQLALGRTQEARAAFQACIRYASHVGHVLVCGLLPFSELMPTMQSATPDWPV